MPQKIFKIGLTGNINCMLTQELMLYSGFLLLTLFLNRDMLIMLSGHIQLTAAFFQVGNAAYHNDVLYEKLRRSIPQLTKLLLSAEEDKTKANAAGALSNLVRNSSVLCEDVISQGAMQVRPQWWLFFPDCVEFFFDILKTFMMVIY